MTELTETQNVVVEALKKSYGNYNDLVQSIIETTDGDYESITDLKRAILMAVSKSLHETKQERV